MRGSEQHPGNALAVRCPVGLPAHLVGRGRRRRQRLEDGASLGQEPLVARDVGKTRAELRDHFAFLNDTSATGYECDHRITLTERFLRERNLPVPPMLAWLGRHGAGCDCEVVLNTGAEWEERVGSVPPDDDA